MNKKINDITLQLFKRESHRQALLKNVAMPASLLVQSSDEQSRDTTAETKDWSLSAKKKSAPIVRNSCCGANSSSMSALNSSVIYS